LFHCTELEKRETEREREKSNFYSKRESWGKLETILFAGRQNISWLEVHICFSFAFPKGVIPKWKLWNGDKRVTLNESSGNRRKLGGEEGI
jgi:hypothetical protein